MMKLNSSGDRLTMQKAVRSDFWASALVRRAEVGGANAVIARKGDVSAGVVLVKVARLDGTANLYVPALGPDGERIWLDLARQGVGPAEADVDAYVRRRVESDPDLWVVEIEDRQGRHFLTEPVDSSG
jgi:hypothetical protein